MQSFRLFYLIEITMVRVGDFRRNIALRDSVNIFCRYIYRRDECIDEIINSADQFTQPPRISPRLRVLSSFLRQSLTSYRFQQATQSLCHAGIQVILDLVEITIVCVCDLWRNIAFTYSVNIF